MKRLITLYCFAFMLMTITSLMAQNYQVRDKSQPSAKVNYKSQAAKSVSSNAQKEQALTEEEKAVQTRNSKTSHVVKAEAPAISGKESNPPVKTPRANVNNNKSTQTERVQSNQANNEKVITPVKDRPVSSNVNRTALEQRKPVTQTGNTKPTQSEQRPTVRPSTSSVNITPQTNKIRPNTAERTKPISNERTLSNQNRDVKPVIKTEKPAQPSRPANMQSGNTQSNKLTNKEPLQVKPVREVKPQNNKPQQSGSSQLGTSGNDRTPVYKDTATLKPVNRQPINAQYAVYQPNSPADNNQNQYQGDNNNQDNHGWNDNQNNNDNDHYGQNSSGNPGYNNNNTYSWNNDSNQDNTYSWNHNSQDNPYNWNHDYNNDNNEHYNWNDHHGNNLPDWNSTHHNWNQHHEYYNFGYTHYNYYNNWFPPHYWYVFPTFSFNYSSYNDIQTYRGFVVPNDWDSGTIGYNDLNYSNYQFSNTHWHSAFCPDYGYGIVSEQDGGDYDFYHFDNYGSRLVQNLIHKHNQPRKIYVEVRGIMNPRTHTIEVLSLHRIKPIDSIMISLHFNNSWFQRPHQWS